MELRAYLKILLRGWWIIIPAFLTTLTASVVFSYTRPPVYRASATFIVSPSASIRELSDLIWGFSNISSRDGSIVSTYAEVFVTRTIVEAAARKLGLSFEQLKKYSFNSLVPPDTNLIKLTVEGDNPQLVRDLTNEIGTETIGYVSGLYEIYDIKLLDPAVLPRNPVNQSKARNVVLGAAFGLMLGVSLVFLQEYLKVPETMDPTIVDTKTGLYNAPYFLRRLKEEISRARNHGHPLALALMSIDRFDEIGELYSPEVKGIVLKKVALYLKHYLKEEELMARLEGDKFVFLLPYTSAESAVQTMDRLRTRMEWNIFEVGDSGVKLNLTVSFGIADCTNGTIDTEELLAEASQALEKAAQNGQNTVRLFKSPSSRAR